MAAAAGHRGARELDGESVGVSASIGVTLYPQDPAAPDQLIQHADQAMYQAKQSGKKRWFFFKDTRPGA